MYQMRDSTPLKRKLGSINQGGAKAVTSGMAEISNVEKK